MTPEEVAQSHPVRHRLCETACHLMTTDKRESMPRVVLYCGGLCQGKRWEIVDKADGVKNIWTEQA